MQMSIKTFSMYPFMYVLVAYLPVGKQQRERKREFSRPTIDALCYPSYYAYTTAGYIVIRTHVCINVRARNTPRHYDSTPRTPWIAFVGLALKIREGPHFDSGENESSCVNESDGKGYGKEWT